MTIASFQARCMLCFTWALLTDEDDADRFRTGEPILRTPASALNPAVVLVGPRTIGSSDGSRTALDLSGPYPSSAVSRLMRTLAARA